MGRVRDGRVPALALLALVGVASGCWIVRVEEPANAAGEPAGLHAQVEETLAGAAAAWNAGDLDAFMGDYERVSTTTYVGAAGLLQGYDAIRARYAPAFEPGAERDSLRFEDLQVRPLGSRHALVLARYVLHRDGEVVSSGPFTLVLQRVEGRWRIIHDHTS